MTHQELSACLASPCCAQAFPDLSSTLLPANPGIRTTPEAQAVLPRVLASDLVTYLQNEHC